MSPKLVDLLERVLWTFVQALAGSIVAGGTAVGLQTFDWRAALAGAFTAALLATLKVVAVNTTAATAAAAAAAQASIPPPAPPAVPQQGFAAGGSAATGP